VIVTSSTLSPFLEFHCQHIADTGRIIFLLEKIRFKGKAAILVSNKVLAGFQGGLFAHPVREFQATGRIGSGTGASSTTADSPSPHGLLGTTRHYIYALSYIL